MRKLVACLVALLATTSANATVIYSTLGPGDSFNTGVGWSISSGQYIAMPFTVSGGNYNFTSAEIALFGGGGNASMRLRADSGGLPGAILETISIPGVTGAATLYTATSASHSLLQNGTTYWIEVLPAGAFSGGWDWASTGVTGPFAGSLDGGTTYFGTNGTLSAFRVNASATPEPISIAVFGGLIIGGVGIAFRRRMAKATA